MSEAREEKEPYIGYEYKEVNTTSSQLSFMIDSYKNFGWELDGNSHLNVYQKQVKNPRIPNRVVLRLKRDRRIMNRTELTRLQRNFESCVKELDVLEKSKTSAAIMYGIMVGLVGTGFMTGSVLAITADDPSILLCVILAIPAILGWIFPYFIYNHITQIKTERANQFIEDKEEEIFQICEKGNKLIE